MSFMCTRGIKEHRWRLGEDTKAANSYLQSSIDIPRIIGANRFDVLYTYAYAAYAMHHNMIGYT